MEAVLWGLQVVLAVLVIVLVLMHSGKDSGLSGAFGVGTGAGPFGGGSLVERNLNRWTIGFALALRAERDRAAQAIAAVAEARSARQLSSSSREVPRANSARSKVPS